MAFSDLRIECLLRSPFRLPPVPHELRLVPVLGLEQGGADGFGQAGVVEADAKVVLRAVAAGARRPGVADAGLADEHPEGRRPFGVPIVIGDQTRLHVDGEVRMVPSQPPFLLGVNVPITDIVASIADVDINQACRLLSPSALS